MVTSNEHIWIVEVQNNNNIQVHFGIMLLSSQNFFSLTRILWPLCREESCYTLLDVNHLVTCDMLKKT